MPIDPSIIGNLKPPTFDPLSMVGEFARTQGSLLNNKLIGQQVAGNQALGNIYAGATDPNTGVLDPRLAGQGIAGLTGDAASIAPQGTADIQAQRQAQIAQATAQAGLTTADLAAHAATYGKIVDMAGGLLGLTKPGPPDPITGKPTQTPVQLTAPMVAQTMTDNLVPIIGHNPTAMGQLTNFLTSLPQTDNPAADDSAIRQKIGAVYQGFGETQDAVNAHIATLKGAPAAVNLGGTTGIFQTSPLTGQTNQDTTLTNTLSPEAEAAPRQVVNPTTGQPGTAPTSSVVTPTGQARSNVPGLQIANGITPTGQIPGLGEAQTAVGQQSGVQYAGDLATSTATQNNIVILKKLSGLLEAPEGKTGPSTQTVNTMRNFLLANAPALLPQGITEAQIQSADQDQIKKYMVQSAAAAASQYGAGTNEKLAVAASGNPNPDMSNLANQDVTRMNLALARAQQGRLAAFQATGLPPAQYSTWASNWNRQVDPRAFMLDVLPAAERAKMLQSITTPAGKQAILQGKAAAEQAGLFQDSDIPR